MNDERLRQRLLAGDPAGDSSLTPDEVHAMRRTVLTAAPEPRRRLLPALALAGATAVAVLIALIVLKPDPAKAPAPRIAAVAIQPVVPLPRPQPLAQRENTEARKVAHRRHRTRAAPKGTTALAALEPSTNPGEDTGTRQVQFSAPGGTRIIWILKSGTASR